MTKFIKGQNDFKIKEEQEYAAKKALDQHHLNLYVLDLNYNSTITEFNKPIVPWLVDFTLTIIMGFDTTEMMKMINMAKDGLLYRLRDNDQVREEENVQAAEDEESIPSDHNYDSESSGTSSEPASSHPRPWTSKIKVKKKIKKLHIMCGGSDNIEHCYILPSRWMDLLEYDIIGDAIRKNFQNA